MKNVLIIIFLAYTTIASATDYYISSSGNDTNNGLSSATPWRTIAKVNSLYSILKPGDRVLFNCGDLWREQLNVPSTGSEGAPIVITSYGTGPEPIIQKTTQVLSWTQVGSTHVYYATQSSKPVNVFISDAYCQPVHWPTTVGDVSPTFKYPSENSADNTHLIDTALTGKVSADLAGVQINIFTNEYYQRTGIVSAFDGIGVMTTSTLGEIPTTSMKYYLTALAGPGNAYADKSWMMSENTWFYDQDAQRLYVWAIGGGNPVVAEVADQSSTGILVIDKSYITIDGINFRYTDNGIAVYSLTTNQTGIIIKNCKFEYNLYDAIRLEGTAEHKVSGIIIDNSVSYNNNYGIVLFNYSTSLVHGNEVLFTGTYPLLPGICYSMLINNNFNDGTFVTIDSNVVSYSSNAGIAVMNSYKSIITNNKVDHTNISRLDGGGIYIANTNNSTLSGNVLTGGTGAGIYLDDWSANNLIELNTVKGGLYGVELSNGSKNNVISRNVLTGPFTAAWEPGVVMLSNSLTNNICYNIIDGFDKSAHGIVSDAYTNNLNNVYNNLIMNCNVGLKDHANTSYAYNNVENNIFYNNTSHINTWSSNIVAVDYNLYFGTGNWSWEGAPVVTFSLWKEASSFDANSLNADPIFTSPTDFHLKLGSPAIGAGIGVEMTVDFDGNIPNDPPSIGAYDYGSKPPTLDIPVCQTAVVENISPSNLELTYNKALANVVPAPSAFAILVNSLIRTVNAVAVSGTKVQLTVSSPIVQGDIVTVSYNRPSSNPLQTPSKGIAESIINQPVVNNCINIAPTVAITSPNNNSTFAPNTNITITVKAMDSDGSIIKVEFYSGVIKLFELNSTPYAYTWENVPAGTYTLTAIATDNYNVTTISPPVEIEVRLNNQYDPDLNIINLYPNPNDGHFSIEFINPLQNEKNEILITDLQGKRVYSSPVLKEETVKQINLSSIKSGIYILMIVYKEILVTKKIIIE